AWIEILHNSSFPWIALKLSREWTPPMMMLDWASGRWVMGLFAESLLFVLGILLRCKHYKRRCKIRAPCCNEIFCCRHCHNESTVPESLAKDRHEICRFDVQTVSSLIPCLNCFLHEGFKPVCARSPASQSLRHRVELVRMSGDSGLGLGGLMLEWGSPGEEGVIQLGSAVDSCKEVGSGRGLYSGCCRLFVPDDLTAFMTYHAAAPFAMSSCLSPCLPPWQRVVRLQVGGADLTCARSVIEETAMPEDYRTRKVSLVLISQVWILCNDCNDTTEVLYHIIGQKCSHCQSYNTRMISPPTVPQ
ncbi:hypothetical protein GW17_00002607, partial [Ensete ventricosum]